ncbi:putative phosphatidylinositol-4-phosphate 5-kinase [Leptomonas seymouri]|uniref:Putative phosphatidylinositol-4-phosphate 5-kinase n=1 Tax=Leptomonas seymouri TaxID=5684 RepID=A0A0N1ILP9_LEPSE|nr:putative phosphatidylinositol-4-phosphate 5-kinase [Leptomonas seymouri]|eukprot:KPI88113.1 putative phosphatidylinositol-4-phosphate 5-kinase [Leptomonas seymouri]
MPVSTAPAAPKDAPNDRDSMEQSGASSLSDVVGEDIASLRHQVPAASSTAQPPDISVMQLHEDETSPSAQPPAAVSSAVKAELPSPTHPADSGTCCQCGQPMGSTKGALTRDGPLHPQCIAEYKFLHQPRCRYCNIRFRDDEVDTFVKDPNTGCLYHPDCHASAEAGRPYVRPTMEGNVQKFAIARSTLTRYNWKSRYFVLSPANGGIRYYVDKATATAGGSGKGKDAKTDEGACYDPYANPDRDANETKRSKGFVPLNNRSRLLTRPNMSNYKTSSSNASDNDIGIIFFESMESQKELRLIFQCGSVEERNAWIKALEAYIYTVDDPTDYSTARAAALEKVKSKEEKEEKEKK